MSYEPNLDEAFREHCSQLSSDLEVALGRWSEAGGGAETVVFDAGLPVSYPRDDQLMPFRPCPHFARWVPSAAPGDLLCVRPGETPRWLRVAPRDYWHEPPGLPEHPVSSMFHVAEVPSREAAFEVLGSAADRVYVGADAQAAEQLGVPATDRNPAPLIAALDWSRAYKTEYEIRCIRSALERAARGHAAVRKASHERCPEFISHLRYLEAAGCIDAELPYPSIIAWDDRTAVLHYQTRRRRMPDPGQTFLIDAGAAAWGYACDVTRTYEYGAGPVFRELLRGMERLQAELVESCAPGVRFVHLHARALEGIARLLHEVEVLWSPPEEALDRGWIDSFMPHGLGHHLGLQVHDVAGRQVSISGELCEPPERWPYLRTTRELEEGHVVTIEPGLYFIPSLLAGLRSQAGGAFDWGMLRELQECGGIRIEDDVWIHAEGSRNLSRELVP